MINPLYGSSGGGGGAVTSVAGKTGVVTLTAADVTGAITNRNAILLQRAQEYACTWWEGDTDNWAQGSNTAGTNQEMNRLGHIVTCNVSGRMRLLYAWTIGDRFLDDGSSNVGQASEPSLPNSSKLINSCALEAIANTPLPAYFNRTRFKTLLPGESVFTDGIYVGVVNKGDFIFSRTFHQVSVGTQFWLNSPNDNNVNAVNAALLSSREVGANLLDKSLTGGAQGGIATDATGNTMWGPQAIFGEKAIPTTPNVLLLGDSIIHGTGDTNQTIQYYGWATRSCQTAGYAYFNLGKGAETIQALALHYQTTRRQWMAQYSTHIVTNGGTNDFASRTLAQIQADAIQYWQHCAASQCYVYHCTLTPVTTSTDEWATTANQTINAQDARRTGFNDWLRDGAPMNNNVNPFTAASTGVSPGATISRSGSALHPLTGYFETADPVESARNSGKWIANYTGDGVHPNTTAHTAIAVANPMTALHSLTN